MSVPKDILDLVNAVKAKGEAIAVATVVRTESAAKSVARSIVKDGAGAKIMAGARAVITADGIISASWMCGSSACDAIVCAARLALADGKPRLIHVRPERASAVVRPAVGAMDIFVEPMLPRPVLAIFGASPVAVALSDLARRMGFFVAVCAPSADHGAFPEADRLVEGFAPPADLGGDLYLVISTQGTRDHAALLATVRLPARYFAVVGPRRKLDSLKRDLARDGVEARDLEKIRAPAGLDIGAITPEEIALSIVAEMIGVRRRVQRPPR
jgi:xanthine dehydrogenase accessory factor